MFRAHIIALRASELAGFRTQGSVPRLGEANMGSATRCLSGGLMGLGP